MASPAPAPVPAPAPSPLPSPSPAAVSSFSLDQFPKEKFLDILDVYQLDGFWYSGDVIPGVLAFQSGFEARSDDVILASSMKTGTTWLKALLACIMESKSTKIIDDAGEEVIDLLQVKNPHDHVKSLEYLYNFNLHSQIKDMQSPRVFNTHLPYSALPDSIKNSDCKIVYIARNPKDTFVSTWHFFNQILRPIIQEPYPIEKAYDSFCKGVHYFGPYLDHVLQYWTESLKMPERILFLKYEDLKKDPKGEVKKLACFLGRPFANEDEVEKVVWRSSFERLRNLEVNKNGVLPHAMIPNSSFFRVGNVGDWENYFTEEMKQGLDEITCMKLAGTGLHFDM
ncbi:Sulfotransferase [Melia azedarach]|uniref:Sulfotransferase n=1 Tax=Melia azedarach TaxID=155640 RepID=A0ACC1YBK3_MELAZ|nr:Sulfotransferase [Melia azedarach]